MKIDRFIALRYLLFRRRMRFVTIISLISIFGVTAGVFALLVVLSVFNGFNGLVTSILVSFDPHIRVESHRRVPASAYEEVERELAAYPEVSGFSPYVAGKALVVSSLGQRVINVRGIDPDRVGKVSGLPGKMVLGSLSFPESGTDGIVIGLTLADRLGSVVGDSIVVVSPAGADEAVLQFSQPLVRRFKIVGIYESNNKDYDAYYAYATLGSAQRLFEMGTDVNGVDVRLHDLDDVEDLKSFLVEKFSSRFRIMTWYDLHRDLYSVMMIERWIAYVILSLIIGIASFNLLGSLTMSVIEKTRDIGVLVSMGATRKMIMGIFMWQGLFVGLAGSVLGIILGVLVVYLQQEYHLAPLDPTVYIIPAIPVELRISDLITIPLTALALCAVAALYPARRAANLAPVDAIRWE